MSRLTTKVKGNLRVVDFSVIVDRHRRGFVDLVFSLVGVGVQRKKKDPIFFVIVEKVNNRRKKKGGALFYFVFFFFWLFYYLEDKTKGLIN